MIRETCNCGASITADHGAGYPETEGRAAEAWRANHRHEPSPQDIANSFCGPVKVIYNPEEDK